MTGPEIRYRRLLKLYPQGHREEYEEEMLAVLLADDRPGLGAAADLVRSAIGARTRWGVRAAREPAWRRAVGVVQLFGAILLLGFNARRPVSVVFWSLVHTGGVTFRPDPEIWLRPAVWLAVVVCALTGRRLPGLLFAVAGAGLEVAIPARYYADAPVRFLNAYPIIVTAFLVALAFVPAGERRGRRSGAILVGLAALTVAADGVMRWAVTPDRSMPYLAVGGRWLDIPSLAMFGAAALFILAAGVLIEPAVRRRVIACVVPVLVALPSMSIGFGGLIEYNRGHPEALRMLGPVQWFSLVAIPVAAFAVAIELNRRLEATRSRTVDPVSAAVVRDK
ncbi:hypothetical protein ACWKSP_29670 [Micromonosporaceae bacterium Da 78-11]